MNSEQLNKTAKRGNRATTMSSVENPLPLRKGFLISCKSPDLAWRNELKKTISRPEEIAEKFSLKQTTTREICENYPARITPYYLSLIKEKGDAIYKQCVPNEKEVADTSGFADPLHEEPENQSRKNVPPLITHRYPDRALFLISNQCAMYCRFCTRKRKVGDENRNPTWKKIEKALEYIKDNEEIRDVILSGGDPLMLSDVFLEKVISKLHAILAQRKNSIIRIGTRIPCVLPKRVTPNLCAMLKKYHPIYINTHFNHPDEITEQSRTACTMLADSGIPVGCQTVLLKGVNDNPVIMKELMQGLINMRVRPYYIYQADPVKGTNHFRTKVQTGLDIYKSLRGHTSGLCVPTYVIDAPGGGGKIPLLPEYVKKISKEKIVLNNYTDNQYEYPEI